MHVELRLLGDLAVSIEGTPVDKASLRRRDAAHLIGLLALARGHRLHREQVVDALWPDAPLGAVGNRLHKAAHFVRKATATRRASC